MRRNSARASRSARGGRRGLESHRQHPLQRGPLEPWVAVGALAGGHDETAAEISDVAFERVELAPGNMRGGNVFEDHAVIPEEVLHPGGEVRRLDGGHVEVLALQDPRQWRARPAA